MERDEALYRQYLSGDERGLTGLMERYGDRLTLYLRPFCDSLEEAEELMVEAFALISLHKPLLRFDSFRAYLFQTGRRLAGKLHRRRLPAFSLDALEHDPESESSLERSFVQDETHTALRRSMDRLDADVREALWLIYFEDLRYSEAAQVLSIKEKQLEYLLRKGKKQLRQELEKEGITDAQY